MLKRILVAIGLGILPWTAALAYDGVYFKKVYGKDGVNVNASLGAVIDEQGSVKNAAFTNVALIYHDADPANTIIPENLQAYIPPESWTLLNLGYGGGLAGLGASINLAATAQGYVSRALATSGSKSAQALSAAIKPGASPFSINVGPEWFSKIVDHSTVLPLNQWKGVPGWFVGGSYSKKF